MLLEVAISESAGAAQPRHALSEAEFNRFYEQHCADLWRYIARMTGDSALADDMFQKTFFRFLRSGAVTGDAIYLKAFLYRVATNLVIDHWRRQKRERKWFSDEPAETASSQPDFAHDVRRLLSLLKPREQALLWMAHVEEMPHGEIAEALGVGEKSVKVLLFRARKRFAALLRSRGITSEVLA